jgi:hypothetical protein
MRRSQRRGSHRWLRFCILGFEIILVIVCVLVVQFFNATQNSIKRARVTATLPGQQVWKQDASSYLFGTNDTYEWKPQNIETRPAIQHALRQAGITLIRSFFSDNATDSEIEQRIQTIENSGAKCLGVMTNISNLSFNKHLVSYLGNRCLMYEFGNEPDYNGITPEVYLQAWNSTIPSLRKINASAKFIGPATSTFSGENDFMSAFLAGVKASRILPDAISFHWYPCYADLEQICLSKAGSNAQAVQIVKSLVQNTLGEDLPIGITEWNYDPENPPPAYGEDPNFITKFTTDALEAMAQAGVALACQFEAASYAGYGRLDMFNLTNDQPKDQYYAVKNMIQRYRPAQPTKRSTFTSTAHFSLATTSLLDMWQGFPFIAFFGRRCTLNKRKQVGGSKKQGHGRS